MALVTFLVMHATPGSPLDPVAEGANPLSPEAQKNLAEVYGLDKPLYVAVRRSSSARPSTATSGTSFVYKTRTVAEIMVETLPDLPAARQHGPGPGGRGRPHARRAGRRLPEPLVGLRLGERGHPRRQRAELRAGRVPDRALLASSCRSSPPAAGTRRRTGCCPTVTLALAPMGIIARFTRSSMLEVIRSDYIVTARAKGLAERPVILKHVLKNALHPGGHPARAHVRGGGDRLVLRGVHLPRPGHGPLLRALDDRPRLSDDHGGRAASTARSSRS